MNEPRYAAVLQRLQDIWLGASYCGTPGFSTRAAFLRAVKVAFSLDTPPSVPDWISPGSPEALKELAKDVCAKLAQTGAATQEELHRDWFFITAITAVPLDRIPYSLPDKFVAEFVEVSSTLVADNPSEVICYPIGFLGNSLEFADFIQERVSKMVSLGVDIPVSHDAVTRVLAKGNYTPGTISACRHTWVDQVKKDLARAIESAVTKNVEPVPVTNEQYYRRSLLARAILELKVSGAVVMRTNKATKQPIKVLELWFWGEEMFQSEYSPDGPIIQDALLRKLEDVLGITK